MAKTKPDDQRPSVMVLEDLNVVGMMQNHKLARAIGDVGLLLRITTRLNR